MTGGARGGQERRRATLDALDRVEIRSLEELRAWLAAHHGQEDGIWLVRHKKRAGAPHVAMSDVVDEALCWGWIDSLPRKLDDARTMVLLTPRRRGSGWSPVNKAKLRRLAAEGRIQPAGQAKIDAARRDGSWTRLDRPRSLEVPDDLAAAFDAAPPVARRFFDRFPPSSRAGILEWVASAKRPETRARRVAEVVSRAAENRKANFPKGRDRGPRLPVDGPDAGEGASKRTSG